MDKSLATNPLAGKHIIVAGAGIAGLAFVRSITRFWPQDQQRPRITVYDRDPRDLPSQRGNYSLGLRSDTGGLQALKQLGLLDEVYAARVSGSSGGNAMMIRNADWKSILSRPTMETPPDGLPTEFMRITRNGIRECLIQGIPDGVGVEMCWGVGCDSAATVKDGRMEVKLTNGNAQECDLLIVADGASSRLRGNLRPDDGLRFAGAVMIGGQAHFAEGSVPEVLQQGAGVVVDGKGHSLVVFPIQGTSWVWFLNRLADKPQVVRRGEEAFKVKDEIVAEVLERGKAYGEPLRHCIEATDMASLKTFNAQDKLPVDHSQIRPLNCMYIGDANHAVSPFAGNGANMAIMDGLALGQALCTSASLEQAAEIFDKESMPKAQTTVKRSHMMISLLHSTGLKLWVTTLCLRVVFYLMRWFR